MSTKTMLYILKRIGLAILTVWVVITVTFFVMHAVPGGPFLSEKARSAAAIKVLEAKYGLDKSLLVQYLTYLKDIVFHFDFGPSIKQQGMDVLHIILDKLRVSAPLGLIAAVIALVNGIVLGAVAALKRNKFVDKLIMVLTTAFVSFPSFIIGAVFLSVFVTQLGWFHANTSNWTGYVLPIITLSLYPMAYITRLMRSSMLDVLGQDYIRTAKAKGVAKWRIIFGHAMKNSLIPVITYFGPMIAYIVTGSIVIEKLFDVPGLGTKFVDCIVNRDYPMIMGTTIILATFVVIMNLVSDILYKVFDPRINFD